MKRIVLSFAAFLFAVLTFAQTTANQPKAMKPIIMVIPEKAWCVNNGFVKSNDPKTPDLKRLFLMMMCLMSSPRWVALCRSVAIR